MLAVFIRDDDIYLHQVRGDADDIFLPGTALLRGRRLRGLPDCCSYK
jgi:hypothetical protein